MSTGSVLDMSVMLPVYVHLNYIIIGQLKHFEDKGQLK